MISLTSFPPRYPTLALTLKCLLTQSIRCDRVILWVVEADFDKLPRSVIDLQSEGLTIATCADDTRSYKKIIHTLVRFPNAFVITADDDIYYWRKWAEELAVAFRDPQVLESHRCHRIELNAMGLPRPYCDWTQELTKSEKGPLVFATTGAGVLYPPGTFPNEFFDVSEFRRLAPSADDIWINWMAQRAGRQFRQIGFRRKFWTWESSQTVSLMSTNVGAAGGNDRQLANLITEYGWPPFQNE